MSPRCPDCGRPTMLDAFSGEGGSAVGYDRAGFCVTGVDINPQPRYPFTHVAGDAVNYIREHGHEFAAVTGSPTCQFFARVTRWRGKREAHENLIPATRDAMVETGRPWVIENVMEAAVSGELRPDLVLCGSMFGLKVRRHRAFETSWRALQLTPRCAHQPDAVPFGHKDEARFKTALGCDWMTNLGGRQAIPPAFTEHIGDALLAHLAAAAA